MKYKKANQKKYYLRKSNRRKPYLDEKIHVRKFKPEEIIKTNLVVLFVIVLNI